MPGNSSMITYLRNIIRNRLSRMIAAMRGSPALQPLHRRYGPVKYRYVVPAYQRIVDWLNQKSEAESQTRVSYSQWAANCERQRYDRNRALARIGQFAYTPTISIILPVCNTHPEQLHKAIDSVLNQYYPSWELCICDDASTAPHVRDILERYAEADARIKVAFSKENGGIARASDRAIDAATGEFIGLLDHDDELTPDALYEVAATLQQTDADLIYSDEDRLDEKDRREDPAFKPAWSPDLLLSCMYIGHFCVYRKSIVDRIGGFRPDFDGSQDYDLALRFSEATSRIAHIPKILYHWRKVSSSASAPLNARPAVVDAGRRALTDALNRRQIEGQVNSDAVYGFYRVRRKITRDGLVSVIVPTRDGSKHLRRCIASIEANTTYANYEILIVDNGSKSAATLDYLKRSPHRVISLDEPFNFSRLNNLAARQASGDYCLFLNDDTEVISPEWLQAMVEHAQRPEVGAVGAKLLYRDGRIQHAGVLLGVAGVAGHAHRYIDGFSGRGYLNQPNVVRNYSAVTAACLMMRRELFLKSDGFDEAKFSVSYNDVDLCLRLRREGFLIVYTPYALLYHDESATRGFREYPDEEASLRSRWQEELSGDSYYNPNLSSVREDFSQDRAKPESLSCVFAQDLSESVVCRLDRTMRIDQSFMIEHDNVCAVAVKLRPASEAQRVVLRFSLRESAEGGSDLAVAFAETPQSWDDQWCFFHFDPVRQSRGKRLSFSIEVVEPSHVSVNVWGHAHADAVACPDLCNDAVKSGTPAFRVHTLIQFRYS